MAIKTGGGNGGYAKRKGISDNPRKPKPAATKGGSYVKRSADGTRANAVTRKFKG